MGESKLEPARVMLVETAASPQQPSSRFHAAMQRLESQFGKYNINLETRGIFRVDPSERKSLQEQGVAQAALLWFSVNLAAINITIGMLGPTAYGLGFTDAALTGMFGMLAGSVPVAYVATFGPRSGLRTLVVARYAMGWWPAKIIVILNVIVCLGYCLIDSVVAGQILAHISPNGSLSVVVGIIVIAIITLVVTTSGYELVHWYNRYAWFPQLVIFCILGGVAGPKFDLHSASIGSGATLAGNRLSFFSLNLATAITWAGGAADIFVYYPEHTPRRKIFTATMIGLGASFTFTWMLGIGLGSGITSVPEWKAAYSKSQGAVIAEAFAPLGGFGKLCAVIAFLGLAPNCVLPMYVTGVDMQVLGRHALAVPRIVWNTLGIVVFTVCAVAGREHLAEIVLNFLALMGYWVVMFVGILAEEEFIFRRKVAFDWTIWNQRDQLPLGAAALTAFVIGWIGAVLGMNQVYFRGPLASLVGEDGADLGSYLGLGLSMIVYPFLRQVELTRLHR